MVETLKFHEVNCGKITELSFVMRAGEIRVALCAGRDEKMVVLDLALGERVPEQGVVTLGGKALDAAPPGAIGWVADNGGLIGNLKVWENVTLPQWYHGRRRSAELEDRIPRWLAALGMKSEAMPGFMASAPGLLALMERKRAGLLRGLVQAPSLLVVDGAIFNNLPKEIREAWFDALDTLAGGAENSSVLVVAQEQDVAQPWQTIG